MSDKEHLLRIRLNNGEIVDMHRQDGAVIISRGCYQVTLPKATGQQTLDVASFFEAMGEVEEIEGGE